MESMEKDRAETELLFEVETPLGFNVRVSNRYWEVIVTVKHPVMAGREPEVIEALAKPDEIRQSHRDPTVYLFYNAEHLGRRVCAVAKRLNGVGFLITTYVTETVKEGVRVWPK